MWSTAREIAAGDDVIVWLASSNSTIPIVATILTDYPFRLGTFFNPCWSRLAKTSTANLATTSMTILLEFLSALKSGLVMAKALSMFCDPPLSCGPWLYRIARKFCISLILHLSPRGWISSEVVI